MYTPTIEELTLCKKLIKEIKGIDDSTVIDQYARDILAITYSIGASYTDENALIKIIKSYQR